MLGPIWFTNRAARYTARNTTGNGCMAIIMFFVVFGAIHKTFTTATPADLTLLLILWAIAIPAGIWLGRRLDRYLKRLGAAQAGLVNDFYPCCGMSTDKGHTNTCRTQRRPPENPAQWSDRR